MIMILLQSLLVIAATVWIAGAALAVPVALTLRDEEPLIGIIALFWLPLLLVCLGWDAMEWIWKQGRCA